MARQGQATSFPTSLSLSNTWNRDLFYDVAWATSDEARAKNNRYNLSYYTPTINMARDPRWGRNEETYGEDPYLTGQLGAQFVKGMQGDDEKYTKIIATIKHFAANNNEAYRRGGTSIMNEFNFRNYYTKVFQNVTEQVMPASVMSSYNGTSIYRNGELIYNFKPSAANYYLLTDLLRRNWGFDGYVTTDCGAGEDMTDKVPQYQQGMLGESGLAPEAYIADALKAGMDLECNLGGGNKAVTYGANSVLKGFITEEELETNIYHLFLQRFKTGEFDNGAKYQDITSSVIESDANVALAEKAAEESWVLLKNEGNILPFKSDINNVAVVGNMASTLALGDYTGSPTKTTTPIQGIKKEIADLNPSAEVSHLGNVADDDKLFNVKSITLVFRNGSTKAVDLSKAENVSGMTLSNGSFLDVTPKAAAVIKGVNFVDVAKVRVEMATGGRIGGSVNIAYGKGGPTVAVVSSQTTADTDTYIACEADYTGEDGGYNGTEDMYISASPTVLDFSVENYKSQLDAADVIIAYAGTIPKQEGFGDSDSAESKDRANINLPAHQSHVKAITDAYPDKTIVVMSTVGQINVEPFMDKCKAILWTSYNGQTQGTALGKVLTGEVNPSGRLTTTWYKNEDLAKMELVAKSPKTIDGITGYYTNYDIQPTSDVDGRTYQYYKNTPVYPFGYGLSYANFEYSNLSVGKDNVDANETLIVSVDVKNTGTVKGSEVVQLYISHPNPDNDAMLPNRQLKEFTKVEIEPNATQKVTFNLNVKDFNLFSEKDQKLYVPTGEYTIYVGKNADDNALNAKVNVSGTLASTLKTVKAMPNGVTVNGLICEDGTGLTADTTIDAKLSAIMSDEVWVDLSEATVKYTSSNTEVAAVNDNGIVTSGAKEGVATITAEVTVNGVTKSDAFPVVNKLKIKPTAGDIANALAALEAEYNKLPKAAYTDTAWAEIEKIYQHGVSEINDAKTKTDLDRVLAQKINNMNSVVMDKLNEKYRLSSVNPKHIEKGTIDYRDGGIPMFDGAEGTVTNASPYSEIQLQIIGEDGEPVADTSKFVWQIKKFDNSVRKVADIDSQTGKLTVYGNGIIQVTAANVEDLTCGTLMIQVNMQIEAEYADNGNGATLTDVQGTPSGGFNAGSTGDAWMEYKSVKLSNLDSIMVRYAGKNAGTINISFAKDTNPENLVAQATPNATGAWSTWATGELDLKKETLDAALLDGRLDEYGCATIYVQTNGVNLDYIRMNYIENDDEVPYVIDKVLNKTNGRMKATLSYRGSTLAKDVVMVSVVKNADGVLKNIATQPVKGTGEYEISTGAGVGEEVSLYIWKSLTDITPLAVPVVKTYTKPVDSEIVIYSLNADYSDGNDYSKLSGGEDGKAYTDTVNGLSGYGGWTIANKAADYTYCDVNEYTYDYSFTKGWQAGSGGKQKRSLFFTPKSACNVTVVFAGAKGRDMYIEQGENKVTGIGVDGQITAFNLDTADTTNPVYVYGGSSNKQLLAIIVEYYGKAETAGAEVSSADAGEPEKGVDRPVQFTSWGDTNVVLTENDATGETKVWSMLTDDIKVQLSTDYFAEADVDYINAALKINRLAEYKNRLYAGCDNGLVAVFTDCAKCYKLKKVCDIDIKNMSIDDGVMYATDGENDVEIKMSDIGGDTIAAEEAKVMALNGASLIDVRSAEEFAEKSVDGSVNIPLDTLKEGLAPYDKDTVLIFYCSAGTRASKAVETAKEMGYTNVYTAGSIDDLI